MSKIKSMNIVIVIGSVTDDCYTTANRFAEELKWHGHNVKTVAVGKDRISDRHIKTKYSPTLSAAAVKNEITLAKPKRSKIKRAFEGADIIHFIFSFRFEKKCRRIAYGMGIPVASAFHA